MGRRKAKKRILTKKKIQVKKVFDCPFCNHTSSVEAKIDNKTMVGTVACRICSADYRMHINSLSEPIDVYSEWIDACEKVNEAEANGKRPSADPLNRSGMRKRPRRETATRKPDMVVDDREVQNFDLDNETGALDTRHPTRQNSNIDDDDDAKEDDGDDLF